ncbi:MAG: glycosyltransferase, partial [Rectinemataceae bacterium]|nr:glycosyltransferase [Rectinemataceae bacterium]
MLDISIVTFNSSRFLPDLFESILAQHIDLSGVTLLIYDNSSSDGTVQEIESFFNRHGARFHSCRLEKGACNLGFGNAHNANIRRGKNPYLFILNPDAKLDSSCFRILLEQVSRSPKDVAAWEPRQMPYEHPKFYHPVTLETPWVSGGGVLVRRKAFEKIGGFEPRLFLYGEDVDLSFRLRDQGFKLLYVPQAFYHHYSYDTPDEIKPQQFLGSYYANLCLRTRFGGVSDILEGLRLYFKTLMGVQHFPKQRVRMARRFLRYIKDFFYFRSYTKKYLRNPLFGLVRHRFYGMDYAMTRMGAFISAAPLDEFPRTPLVSVLIRTVGRRNLLRAALKSVENQTYQPVEVIVVEDGAATISSLLEEFPSLSIQYHAFGENRGRCEAGNQALRMAKGEYCIFLDEDDLFFADHIETLVAAIIRSSARVAYSFAFEVPTAYREGTDIITEEGKI